MKKMNLPLLWLVCLLCALTSSCSRAEELPEFRTDVNTGPVRILVDIEVPNRVSKHNDEFVEQIRELGGPEELEIEYVPTSGPDRDSVLTGIRTEIMSGKGPDLFICTSGCGSIKYLASEGDYQGYHEEALFKFPRSAMESRVFLPLDNYIENAQFMDWDKYIPTIMEAGRNERGQMILPLSYTLPVTLFHRDDYWPEPSKTTAFDEMASGNVYERYTATHDGMYQVMVFRDLVEEKRDRLAISEEEYLDYVRTWVDLKQTNEKIKTMEGNLSESTVNAANNEIGRGLFGTVEVVSIVPYYCMDGGYGAAVCTFGAINANSKSPAGAFFVLDYIMSEMGYYNSPAGGFLCNYAIPTHTYPARCAVAPLWSVSVGNQDGYWNMPSYLYDEYEKIRSNISWARLRTALDAEFGVPGSIYINDENNRKSLEDLVHESYVRMNMILGES